MPKHYDNVVRQWSWEDREKFDMNSPRYEWPAHRRALVDEAIVGRGHHCGDVITIGVQRVCVLAYLRSPRRYLVAPDSPTVGLNVAARVFGRMLRRAYYAALDWAFVNDLSVADEYVVASWRDLRFPWRRASLSGKEA